MLFVLQNNHNMPFFPTSKDDSCPIENMFNVVRAMDGSNKDPNALELNWRLGRIVVQKILMDKNFDYKILKPILENHLKELEMDDGADDEDNDDALDGLQFIDNDFDFENDIPEEISGLLEQTELVEDENGEMVYTRKETPKDDEVEGVKWVGIR